MLYQLSYTPVPARGFGLHARGCQAIVQGIMSAIGAMNRFARFPR
jgi:hypothetical protein